MSEKSTVSRHGSVAYHSTTPTFTLERRAVARRNVELPARIKCWSMDWLPCTVVNVSSMGALVLVSTDQEFPQRILLQIPKVQFESSAVVRHQGENRIGVEFLSAKLEALAKFG